MDSPKTPITPSPPAEITLHRRSNPSVATLSVNLLRADSSSNQPISPHSRSLYQKHFGLGAPPRPLFFPPDLESAKSYLKETRKSWLKKQNLPPKFPKRILDPLATPLSSRDRVLGEEMGVCHGCHGKVGDGAHVGSAIGKNLCRNIHSNSCPGGYIDDVNWKGCPLNYRSGLMSGSGFEHTMQQSEFLDQSRVQNQPFFSTPQFPDQSFIQLSLQDQMRQVSDQPQQMVRGGQHQPGLHGPDQQAGLQNGVLRESFPVNYNDNPVDLTLSQVNRGQQQVDELRTINQAAAAEMVRNNQPGVQQLNIRDLRALPELSGNVDGHMGVIRQDVPSLIPAPSAQPRGAQPGTQPGTQPGAQPDAVLGAQPGAVLGAQPGAVLGEQPGAVLGAQPGAQPGAVLGAQPGAYSYNSAQLYQVTGDGIRVSSADVNTQLQLSVRPKQRFPSFVSLAGSGQQQHQLAMVGGQHQSVREPGHLLPPPQSLSSQQQPVLLPGQQQGAQPYVQQGHPQQYQPISGQRLGGKYQSVSQYKYQQQQNSNSKPLNGIQPMHNASLPNSAMHGQYPSHYSQHVQPGMLYNAHQGGHFHGQPLSPQQLPQHYQPSAPPPDDVPHQPSDVSYQYVTDSTGRQILVKSSALREQLEPQQQVVQGVHPVQQPGIQFGRTAQYRVEYRCDPSSGELYQVEVPISPPRTSYGIQQQPNTSSQFRTEFRCDPNTGHLYKVSVPTTPHTVSPPINPIQPKPHSVPLNQQRMDVTSLPWNSSQPAQDQSGVSDTSQSRAQQIEERVKGIVSFVEQGGATKKSKLVDYAKHCSAKWVTQATASNMNLALYGYAAVSELEAGLTGKSSVLSQSELISKLSHLKSVFEVCCINSQAQDFTGYGWTLARDYAKKVESKVDQRGLQWQDVSAGVQTDMLMMAQCDYPRPVKTVEVKEKKKAEIERSERPCTTYNTCTTESKCEYEVSNPGKSCQRKHECSYCRKHFKRSCEHQETKCIKKQNGVVGAGH